MAQFFRLTKFFCRCFQLWPFARDGTIIAQATYSDYSLHFSYMMLSLGHIFLICCIGLPAEGNFKALATAGGVVTLSVKCFSILRRKQDLTIILVEFLNRYNVAMARKHLITSNDTFIFLLPSIFFA